MDTITTAGERFTMDDHARLAWMVFIRFGRSIEAGASAWRRMLQNGCTDRDFRDLVYQGQELAGEGSKR